MTSTLNEAVEPSMEMLYANGVHRFPLSISPETFSYFKKYDYTNWKPPVIRRNWIKAWVQDGEFLDIGCGGYPVTMDVPNGKKRGVGADISLGALKRFRHYFREFLFLDIEHVREDETVQLCSRFKTVVMSETLEHFSNPLNVLGRVRTLLSPDGYLLVTYPNAFSFAQYVDWVLHCGKWKRFEEFHRSHIYLVRKSKLEELFKQAGYHTVHFDFRPSNLVGSFPSESNPFWKNITKFWPSFLAHQFFYVLERNTH